MSQSTPNQTIRKNHSASDAGHHDTPISTWWKKYSKSGEKVISNLGWPLSWSMSKMYNLHNSLNHEGKTKRWLKLSTSTTVLCLYRTRLGKNVQFNLVWGNKDRKWQWKRKESNESGHAHVRHRNGKNSSYILLTVPSLSAPLVSLQWDFKKKKKSKKKNETNRFSDK